MCLMKGDDMLLRYVSEAKSELGSGSAAVWPFSPQVVLQVDDALGNGCLDGNNGLAVLYIHTQRTR